MAKRKRLFFFRAGETCGTVRAYDVLEALDLLHAHFPDPIDIRRIPDRRTVFIPLF